MQIVNDIISNLLTKNVYYFCLSSEYDDLGNVMYANFFRIHMLHMTLTNPRPQIALTKLYWKISPAILAPWFVFISFSPGLCIQLLPVSYDVDTCIFQGWLFGTVPAFSWYQTTSKCIKAWTVFNIWRRHDREMLSATIWFGDFISNFNIVLRLCNASAIW